MAKVEITEWECDNCTEPALPAQRNSPNPMPENWVNLMAQCDEGWLFELDLCADCFDVVRSALLGRKPIRHDDVPYVR